MKGNLKGDYFMKYVSKETILVVISDEIEKTMNEFNKIKLNDPKKKQLYAVWIKLLQLRDKIARYDFDEITVQGHWIDIFNKNDSRMKCSICGSIEEPLARHNYCPNCGAKMKEEKNL